MHHADAEKAAGTMLRLLGADPWPRAAPHGSRARHQHALASHLAATLAATAPSPLDAVGAATQGPDTDPQPVLLGWGAGVLYVVEPTLTGDVELTLRASALPVRSVLSLTREITAGLYEAAAGHARWTLAADHGASRRLATATGEEEAPLLALMHALATPPDRRRAPRH